MRGARARMEVFLADSVAAHDRRYLPSELWPEADLRLLDLQRERFRRLGVIYATAPSGAFVNIGEVVHAHQDDQARFDQDRGL